MEFPKSPQPQQSPFHGYPVGHLPRVERRQQLSREEWMVLKPLIHELYINQKKSFKYIANVLKTREGFAPTKHQFTRKITEWAFRKNARQVHRGQIMDVSSSAQNTAAPRHSTPISERLTNGTKQDGSQPSSQSKRTLTETSNLDELFQLLQIDGHEVPSITELVSISSLYIDTSPDEEEYIDRAELMLLCNNAPSNSRRPASNGRLGTRDSDKQPLPIFRQRCDVWFPSGRELCVPSPMNEVYVFPSIAQNSPRRSRKLPSLVIARKDEEVSCNLLQHLKKVAGGGHPAVFKAMLKVARACKVQGKFEKAERFYRQAIGENKSRSRHISEEYVYSHLELIPLIVRQRRTHEALETVENFYVSVLNRVEPWLQEYVRIKLRLYQVSILSQTDGASQATENACREVLQVALDTLGHKDHITRSLLRILAYLHLKQGRFKEQEQLCHAMIQIHMATPGSSPEFWLSVLAALSICFARQNRWHESMVLIKASMHNAEILLGEEHPTTLTLHLILELLSEIGPV